MLHEYTAQTEHDGAKRAKLRNIMRPIARFAPYGLKHKELGHQQTPPQPQRNRPATTPTGVG